MPIEKKNLPIPFIQGLDLKTDPLQVEAGKFLALSNSIFTKAGLLEKRNGFPKLTEVPSGTNSALTTFNDNLTVIGDDLWSYSEGAGVWKNNGAFQPCSLSTLSLIRNSLNQTQVDTAIASNGVVCAVYSEVNAGSTTYKWALIDGRTGQNLSSPAAITPTGGTVTGAPKVFVLGNYFIVVFTATITAVPNLEYFPISINSLTAGSAVSVSAIYTPSSTGAFDGVVANGQLYLAWNGSDGGGALRLRRLDSTLTLYTVVVIPNYVATLMSVTADITSGTSVIYVSFYNSGTSTGYTMVLNQNLVTINAPIQVIASGTVLNLTSSAQNGVCTLFYEISNTYGYDGALHSNYIKTLTVTPLGSTFRSIFSTAAGTITASSATGLSNGSTLVDNTTPANIQAGTTFTISGTTLTLSHNTAGNSASSPGDQMAAATVTAASTLIRSVGLASKAVILSGVPYFLAAYSSVYQPTYFLINGSGQIVAKLAYSNGGGYVTTGLGNITATDNVLQFGYLFKDLIQAVNKTQAATTSAGVYSQTGVNLASVVLPATYVSTVETAHDLHLSGGFLWVYDGVTPVEHNFFLWPDNVECTWSATGGSIVAKPDGSTNTNAYYYQVTYEWADNQGNIFRSAPSIPVGVTTTGAGSAGSITVNVPSLRLTYKTQSANLVKIVVYRWSVAQQSYFQVTSITSPTLNPNTLSTDTVAFVDTLADASIIGNNLIYTTGGVIEDVNAPSSSVMTLFDSRVWVLDAEDRNVWWYSKKIVPGTPVEMSDLFTYYVDPNLSPQGNTGPVRAGAAMDDKLISFKKDAIFYTNGKGPNDTGANNQYSDPTFITSTVGCDNQASIVFIPQGLMFQSDKGIWLLGRDLSTQYIGAPVNDYNEATVLSAVNVPGTNQVRFTLDNGVTLQYDYFYNQWATFSNIPGTSATIYRGAHTYLNSTNSIFQQDSENYLDGSSPVLMSFTTSWVHLASLQGYQRAYFFYLLGTYLSPHKLFISIAYDYEPSPTQTLVISPVNYTPNWGDEISWGSGGNWGGNGNIERWKINFNRQKCEAFQISVSEIYDPTFGVAAGPGLTLSGLNLVVGLKKGYRPLKAALTTG